MSLTAYKGTFALSRQGRPGTNPSIASSGKYGVESRVGGANESVGPKNRLPPGCATSTVRLSGWLFGVLCITFLACVAFRIGGAHVAQAVDDLGELAAALIAAAGCALTASRQLLGRKAWAFLGASALSWACGETIWCCYDLIYHTNPFPSLADVGFLCAIPFGTLGLIFFADPQSRPKLRRRATAFGSAAATVLISWVAVAVVLTHAQSSQAAASVLGVAYPLGDLLIISIGMCVLRQTPVEHTPLILVIGGMAAFTAADTSFAYLNAIDAYGIGNALDTGWVLGYLLFALGALMSNQASLRVANRKQTNPPGFRSRGGQDYRAGSAPDDMSPYRPMAAGTSWFTPKAADHMVNGLVIVLILADAGVSLYDLALMIKALA
jgi:diguanylate cyclase